MLRELSEKYEVVAVSSPGDDLGIVAGRDGVRAIAVSTNSSFSWWGSVLNEQDDAMVICPSRWTLTADKTIALDKWMKL